MLFLILNQLVHAELPMETFPECGEVDRSDLCPNDLGTRWNLISYIPEHARESIREAESDFGSGNRLDRALRINAGRHDVVVAVLDSGFLWKEEDLRRKYYLHKPELPLPQFANGEEASDYDLNGDGIFSIDDYEEDPRVAYDAGITGSNDVLDVSDLLYTFSDGIDDDGNGYVDDISGWDFFGWDNDAFQTYDFDVFGLDQHGTGTARESVGEGNNGHGKLGACPNCALLPMRLADSVIGDGARTAAAIAYAADIGAVSISMAVVVLNNPDIAIHAAEYAYNKGTIIAGVSSDLNTFHQNYSSVLDNAMYVHAILHNTTDNDEEVYSYMNTKGCNNFGMRMDMVAATAACGTGSAAVLSGAIGLVHSLGRDLELDLSAGEVYQLLTQNAIDVNLSPSEQSIAGSYPSYEGWDPYYGYGRVDLSSSLEAVVAGKIPPDVQIKSPRWFEYYDQRDQQEIEIQAAIQARNGIKEWTLHYGLGHEPREWIEIASGTDTDISASLDISQLPIAEFEEGDYNEKLMERFERTHQPAVTLKLSATDNNDVAGERQKTVFVHRDPDLLDGFPIRTEGSLEASIQLADLDDDGDHEMITADSSGILHVYQDDGSELSGFPVYATNYVSADEILVDDDALALRDNFISTPAVGDIDQDGDLEIVISTLFGKIHAWHHDGTSVNGFPASVIGREPDEFDQNRNYDQGFLGAVTLYDLDGDGGYEIIAAGMDARLYVFDHTGADWGPYPIDICNQDICGDQNSRSITSPAVGDIDGDGEIEIIIGNNMSVNAKALTFMFDALTGTHEEGWPHETQRFGGALALPLVGEGHPSPAALADIDGDGDLEIADTIALGVTNPLHHDNTEALSLPYVSSGFDEDTSTNVTNLLPFNSFPAWGDLTGDGTPDLVNSGVSALQLASTGLHYILEYQVPILAWDGSSGDVLPGWPRQIEDIHIFSGLSIADVSGDGKPEVLAASAGYMVHAWDGEGNESPGFPKFTGNWVMATPNVGDIDGDGYLELVVGTRDGLLFAWKTQGRADQTLEWIGPHHDLQNTSNYHHPIPTQAGPSEEVIDSGCCSDKTNGEAALLLLPLSLFALRRRRPH
ncbi:MAG: FG-GAP-like repeat-containing protein [Myxococcota bacterium]|nr:FG-GAP-like repeat-containing protein [Myxococcota bacterium]